MKRYLITFLFTILLVSGLTAFAADTDEPAGPDLTISASSAEAAVGEEITFTVTMGPVDDLLSLQMRISLPDGLTCTGSEMAEDLQDTLQFDSLEWDETSLTLSGDGGHYTGGKDTELFTFRCEADGSFLGDVSVSLSNLEMYCGYSDDERSYEVTYSTNVFPAEINITDNENIPTAENFILDTGTSRKIHTAAAENGETNYTFTSSDPAVVSVEEDGTVTALAEGTATVTAAGNDGGETVYNVTVPHQHTYGEWEIVTEATETGPGLQTRTCTVCGSTQAQVIPQLEAAGDADDQSDSDTGSGGFLHSPWLEVVIVAVIVVVAVIILLIYTRHKNRKG